MPSERLMEEPPSTKDKVWISVGLAVLGISLVAVSMFVSDDPAHILLTRVIQILMTISGSICVVLAVILYFVRDSPDINM